MIEVVHGEEITGYAEEFQNRKQFFSGLKRQQRKKSNNLFVKWKVYDNSLSCWINARAIL